MGTTRFSTISYTRYLGVVVGLLLAVSANANLIVNGGFEDNTVPVGNWGYFPSASVNGWDGDNIEIWNQMGGVVAPQGLQHAEHYYVYEHRCRYLRQFSG